MIEFFVILRQHQFAEAVVGDAQFTATAYFFRSIAEYRLVGRRGRRIADEARQNLSVAGRAVR